MTDASRAGTSQCFKSTQAKTWTPCGHYGTHISLHKLFICLITCDKWKVSRCSVCMQTWLTFHRGLSVSNKTFLVRKRAQIWAVNHPPLRRSPSNLAVLCSHGTPVEGQSSDHGHLQVCYVGALEDLSFGDYSNTFHATDFGCTTTALYCIFGTALHCRPHPQWQSNLQRGMLLSSSFY